MRRSLLTILFVLSSISAQEESQKLSSNKLAHLVQKGEKIAQKLCEAEKLSQITAKNLSNISKQLEEFQPCMPLNKRNQEALSYFLMEKNPKQTATKEAISVPPKSKCPVCGMFVTKYPKWVSTLQINEKIHYFDGVKDMMKFYVFDVDFPYDRSKIKEIKVTDFYTLKAMNAQEAFYVLGSDIYGPMGNEFIPFKSEEGAKNFMKDHHAEEIIRFQEITPKRIMALDGIEYKK
jgi:nitrous oxide reductase accessory protein NosL